MAGRKYRILIVDDDQDLLRLLSMRLTGAGYEVSAAMSGEQAQSVMPTFRPHMVITDLRMDGMDGMALFDSIRSVNTSLPVIILTAHGSIPDAVSATKQGVFSFLTKPFDGKELLLEVKKALSLTGVGLGRAEMDVKWREDIIFKSPVMEDLLNKAKLLAANDSNVLIRGESGTGKELLAKAIHRASSRSSKPFVVVNCGAIPEELLESELFGHIKGSFTGAVQNYSGLFRSAQGGTLLLDEIGDMPISLQVKLLRVIQEKQVRPVGSTRSIDVDVRIISATHRDLEKAIETGNFREDLYYRLNVVPMEVPPLSERREDIPVLVTHFLEKLFNRTGKRITGFAPDAMEMLLSAPWPGNVRQLLNVVEQAVVFAITPVITADLLNSTIRENSGNIPTFHEARREFEREYLVSLLQMTKGNVTQAARFASRNRTDFYKILQRHHIAPSLFKA
ncbi:MAG: sigma 54-interacting transcriptional regulator [Thermodesulfobacteriota bacterium]|nr:sigma 54-interacting transcriptional regulator [Thermodesulfobacteriota bacterium]